jgi:hypothetical protein
LHFVAHRYFIDFSPWRPRETLSAALVRVF